MKASVIRVFEEPEVQRYENVADPTPASGELVIKVDAYGINRYDLYIHTGAVFPISIFRMC